MLPLNFKLDEAEPDIMPLLILMFLTKSTNFDFWSNKVSTARDVLWINGCWSA